MRSRGRRGRDGDGGGGYSPDPAWRKVRFVVPALKAGHGIGVGAAAFALAGLALLAYAGQVEPMLMVGFSLMAAWYAFGYRLAEPEPVASALFLALTQTALFLVREFGVVRASPTFSSEFFAGVRIAWLVFLWAIVPGAFRLESLRRTNPRGDPALIGRGRRSSGSVTRRRALDRAGDASSRSLRTWLIPGGLALLGFAALISASRNASPTSAFDAFETAWRSRGTDAVAALAQGDRRERVAAALARLDEREGWANPGRPLLGTRREVVRHEQAFVYHPIREAAERTLRTAWVRRGDDWRLIQCRIYPKGEVPDDGTDGGDDADGR